MPSTIQHILKESEQRLHGVDSPRLCAELLLAEVIGCSRLTLVVDRDRELQNEDVERIRALVERRSTGEPVAYILGKKEFYGLDFMVTQDVLIPRPETEHIIEAVEGLYGTEDEFYFADLGTGSGILAVTLTHLFPRATGVAVDVSSGALAVTRRNAAEHGVTRQLSFVEGDFTAPLFGDATFDLIVSNPPYVPEQEYNDASHEVTAFEPVGALKSGVDGLDHIRAMLPRVSDALKSGGRFLVEIGYQQADAIKIITSIEFPQFSRVDVFKDFSGHDRIILLQKN